jgi:hypothetical protein
MKETLTTIKMHVKIWNSKFQNQSKGYLEQKKRIPSKKMSTIGYFFHSQKDAGQVSVRSIEIETKRLTGAVVKQMTPRANNKKH